MYVELNSLMSSTTKVFIALYFCISRTQQEKISEDHQNQNCQSVGGSIYSVVIHRSQTNKT